MNGMRLCMYTPIFPPRIGGPSTQSFNLCKALAMKGKTCIVVTYGDRFGSSEAYGFTVYTFRSLYTRTPLDKAIRWIVFPFYIAYILKKERIDVLHCHTVSMPSFIAGGIARLFGIPRIIKFAGDWVGETLSGREVREENFDDIYTRSPYSRFLTGIERFGLRQFDKIWVVSEFRRENVRKLLGTSEKTVVIPNCLLLSGGAKRSWSADDPVIVISANRFIPHKRIPFIVELFAKLALPHSRLVLVGGGEEREVRAVREAAKRSGAGDRVRLTGILPSEKVYEEFSKASFYISTSLEEGFPNVFIEAMHYGLPIVTSDAGGSKELVLNNETGFVVEPHDTRGFLDAMRRLATDIPLRSAMSEKARERSKLFDLTYRVEEFIELYTTLLKKKEGRA